MPTRALANGGVRVPPVPSGKSPIARAQVICEQGTDRPCQDANGAVISPVDAFLITDVLSDNEARAPAFGTNSVLHLADRPVAAKTGTTNDYRDNLTMGYTPQLVTGVWVGNSNNSPMHNVSGVAGAGPIWNEFMTIAHAGEPVMAFTPPAGVRQIEVCADTGAQPSEACPSGAATGLPTIARRCPKRRISGRRSKWCAAPTSWPPNSHRPTRSRTASSRSTRLSTVSWAEQHGIAQPPPMAPSVTDPSQYQVAISDPPDGLLVPEWCRYQAAPSVPDFANYELQYGDSHDPGAFSPAISARSEPR